MKGEAGYGEGLDELMTGLYGPNVLRSAEGVGGYTNVRTGQQISKIDESSYNIYIQNKTSLGMKSSPRLSPKRQ